jgi:hypothetical protein
VAEGQWVAKPKSASLMVALELLSLKSKFSGYCLL